MMAYLQQPFFQSGRIGIPDTSLSELLTQVYTYFAIQSQKADILLTETFCYSTCTELNASLNC